MCIEDFPDLKDFSISSIIMPRGKRTKRQLPPPPPAKQTQSSPGFGTALFSTIAQGFAFGTGSSVAHRTVDSVVGIGEKQSTESSVKTQTDYNTMGETEPFNPTEEACFQIFNDYHQCVVTSTGEDREKCRAIGRQVLDCLGAYPEMANRGSF